MICNKLKECVEKQFVNESIKNCSNKQAICIETSDKRTRACLKIKSCTKHMFL